MRQKSALPDAWDDDWEALADKSEEAASEQTEESTRLSKAQRKAQHAEANRKLWESADTPDTPIFLQAKEKAPLASDFKAPLKLLSRKPPPATADPSRALGDLSIADDGEDSEEEERRRAAQSFTERQAKAQREREEKQRKYAEARERIMGSPAAVDENASRSSSKGAQHSGSRNSSRGKGRGKTDVEGVSSNDQSPARGGTPKRQLFDPSYTSKPTSSVAQRAAGSDVRLESAAETQHVRAPRGPDSNARGGFGLALRDGKNGTPT